MNFNTSNLLCFHLNLFNNFEQVLKMMEDRNLLDLDPYIIWDSKMEGRLKIWIDSDTFQIIFWTQKGDRKGTICINSNYLNTIHNLKSITYNKKVTLKKEDVLVEDIDTSNLDINQSVLNIILDKILSKGLDSLNDKEKIFLKKYSD